MWMPALPLAAVLSLAADVPETPRPAADPAKPDIALELAVASPPNKGGAGGAGPVKVRAKDELAWTVHLVNRGKVAVTLIKPGDGSECGWRTPIITWTVAPAPPPERYLRCGNMNPLKADEIFDLKPGERLKLSEWMGGPPALRPGKYTITVRYKNDPTINWSRKGFDSLDPVAAARGRASTPLDIQSNPVEIVVEE